MSKPARIEPGTDALSAVPRQRAFIGMGGNLGDVAARLNSALEGLSRLPGTSLEAVSAAYRTRPVDAAGPDYINAVAVLSSSLGPHELLGALLTLERDHERERPYRHAPRTLDLDLLWYGGSERTTSTLTLPHPRMMARAFVLEPLAEVLGRLPQDVDAPVLPSPETRRALAQAQGISLLGPLQP